MTQAEKILQGHLKELRALLKRMEPEHIARDTIKARIKECQDGIKAVKART